MAITSYGYPGTISPGKIWAQMQWGLGHRYWVYNPSTLTATPVTGGTRQVSLSAGYFGGYGILDYSDTATTVTLPTVSSGTRYFMIVARRTWGTTNATTFTTIDAGTTGNTTLPTRNTDYGVLDDQPLWMVPLTAGDTVPGTPIDLRLIGPEGIPTIQSLLALPTYALAGMALRYGTDTYFRQSSGTTHSWSILRDPLGGVTAPLASYGTQGDVIASNSGWSGGSMDVANYGYKFGNAVHLLLAARRTGASIPCNSAGSFSGVDIMTITAPYRPDQQTPFAFTYYGGSTDSTFAALGGIGRLFPDGTVRLDSGLPSQQISSRGSTGSPSFLAAISFIQRGS